jgi:hypothetical protein
MSENKPLSEKEFREILQTTFENGYKTGLARRSLELQTALQLLRELNAEIEDNYMVIMKDDKKHIRIKEILSEGEK